MLILVDGYNVAMADPDTRDLDKESMREALVTRLACSGARMLGRGRITVVFDARDQLGVTTETRGTVAIVYAPDADTEIVRRAAAAAQVAVVTNDLRLRARISQDVSRRVEYRDASAAFAAASREGSPGGRTKRAHVARESGLPKGHDGITAELAELWVDEDE